MSLSIEFVSVPLSEISSEEKFSFSIPSRKELIKESIRNFGILQPPVIAIFSEKLILIDGEARILAGIEAGIKETKCVVLKSISKKQALALALELNLSRGLNLAEKAEFIKKAKEVFSKDEIFYFLKKLGVSPSNQNFFFLLSLSKLETEFKELLAEEKLNPKAGQILAELEEKERKEFLALIKSLRLSFSEQLQVLEKLLDCKKRYEFKELIPPELKVVLKEEDFNKRKNEFMKKLNLLYYPNYFPKYQKVNSLVQSFKEKGIHISFPPYFEEKEVSLSLRVKSPEEYEKSVKDLESLLTKVVELFKIL
ncbi:MAG: ParB N-terminal domain-containing protein [Thermodesulfobacteria bacterium]|nr:ParB N-terminal domain-containing protein [Thermodesulfobacteriota bacterium]